ncbi:MAG: ZIP family metal transporter [Candidatus Amulumruptor caecigallinarius]|nr:ZIP family metal transporter [Candidatus Amulumruptor caecigallinarius]MCM1397835.1 ZIP family metal transporter [Candidatus Amulumruptor caecigallinarius]MCM1454892.1 ZIP family metal transporter [bacterium]
MEGLVIGILLPLLGTTLGAACVFMMRRTMAPRLQKGLTGFAAGVMVAASVWSLLIPSVEMTGRTGLMSILPAVVGFMAGIIFLLFLDEIVPHQHIESSVSEGPRTPRLSRTSKLVFAVTLHNIPEGMAVGVALAAALQHNAYMPMAGAVALAVGIAIQNFPEGAIVSMPLHSAGNSRWRSFLIGTLSGVVEPVGAVITILLASLVIPVLPYLLAFAAGAMMYVVVEELIPETQQGTHSNVGTLGFAIGFLLMMVLDVLLG